jgi:alpha/beta superfamily hydrolase
MKVWLLAASFLLASVTQAQDYERERRWAAEFVPNLVVGDAVRIALPPRNFLGIHTEGKPGRPAILLLHGLGVHPDHGVIGILRTLLVDAGYTTLSIQMPVQGAQATADDYPALFAEAAARIQAAAGWLADKGHARPVLLSHSMGSRMATAYYERTAGAPFAAWISLGVTADYGALEKVRAPILDVYGEKDFPQVLRANPVRRMAVSAIAGSKQVMIQGADHYYTGRETALASAIDEFLGEQACRGKIIGRVCVD